jgi:MoaA/NifB/PqqE/SkfB family radical SAM enzyme
MKLSDVQEIVIEASSYCNAHCPHCPRFTAEGELHPDLPLAHLRLSQLAKLPLDQLTGLHTVTFEGDKGEPLMNPELLDLIALFPQSVNIIISTNGGILTTAWWSGLAKIPNVTVYFSIDGLADTNHLYRISVDWNRVQTNAQAYIDAGGRAVWRCLVFKHNEHQLASISELSQKMGFDQVIFRLPQIERFESKTIWPIRINNRYSHDLMPTTLSAQQIFSHNRAHRLIMRPRHKPTANNLRCKNASRNKIYIGFQGEVLPCAQQHFETLNRYPGQEQFRKFVGDFDRINLAHNDLDYILTNVYGDYLEHSLATNMLSVCKKTCYPEL